MRNVIIALGLTSLLLSACNHWPPFRDKPIEQARTFNHTPTPEQLVKYLNANAQRVEGLECRQVFIDAKQNNQTVGLDATLVCQKPRNFRLVGRVAGSSEVDMGSNDQEFWWWIKRAEPAYVYHCSYDDFRRGIRSNFPFQPDWIMEALGIATYPENKKYQVRETQTTVELIEQTVSPQGQPLRKVIVFNRGPASSGKPQVLGYAIQDASGREIAVAHIQDVQYDQATGAVLPRRIQFSWPAEKVEMKMKLDGISCGPIDAQRAAGIFNRRNLSGLPSYDLARGTVDGQSGPLQRTGGPLR
jgi:hypothetical protein